MESSGSFQRLIYHDDNVTRVLFHARNVHFISFLNLFNFQLSFPWRFPFDSFANRRRERDGKGRKLRINFYHPKSSLLCKYLDSSNLNNTRWKIINWRFFFGETFFQEGIWRCNENELLLLEEKRRHRLRNEKKLETILVRLVKWRARRTYDVFLQLENLQFFFYLLNNFIHSSTFWRRASFVSMVDH
jgi:hypothetical protein